jgi:hypothetical protein
MLELVAENLLAAKVVKVNDPANGDSFVVSE